MRKRWMKTAAVFLSMAMLLGGCADPTETETKPQTETKAQTCNRAPCNRFLFRLSPYVNLFYCLLLFNHPMGSIHTEDTLVIGISPRQNIARTWTLGVYY